MANINVRDYIDESYGLFINNEFKQVVVVKQSQ